ncbi:GNAT family N-acetyltransferase [Flavobacterium humi]|uniref:N-acetyltransferase n=1 Tax=Flavobacterium humi TaxID=2562683 RepID=A0A4Z0LD25_9FLAO|nr:GNAT family N-acetyltransferase [Flavobacterium humi]TGD59781.1 N-acetyltransferase [Flavobacterium humi]
MKNIAHKNIENLTSLWKIASLPFEGFHTEEKYHFTQVPHSDWPQKLWFTHKPEKPSLQKAFQLIKDSAGNLSYSHWDDFASDSYQIIEKAGFVKKSEQIGMSLKLNQKVKCDNRLVFKKINNKEEANIWAEIYPLSFGYTIDAEVVDRSKTVVEFYLAYFEGNPIGTAMVLFSDNVIGIHGVGVIPEMRKKGFAEEIMQFLINQAIDRNVEYATLQSSAMGKNIYLKMGFSEDFLMTNYTLPVE